VKSCKSIQKPKRDVTKASCNYLEVNLASFQQETPFEFRSSSLRQHNEVTRLQQPVITNYSLNKWTKTAQHRTNAVKTTTL